MATHISLPDVGAPLVPHPRWKVHSHGDLAPGSLVLVHNGREESTGVDFGQLGRQASLTSSDIHHLHRGGIALSDRELAVHMRLTELIGYGAFGAAHVDLLGGRFAQPVVRRGMRALSAHELLHGDHLLGQVNDGIVGPPYLALYVGDAYTDCLLLTWSHSWLAFRSRISNGSLHVGVDHFARAATLHPKRVTELLGPSLASQSRLGGACVN